MYTFISTRQCFCANYFWRAPIESIPFEDRKQSNILSITIKKDFAVYFLHKNIWRYETEDLSLQRNFYTTSYTYHINI